MDSFLQINNFSSVFELFVAYYLAFIKLPYIQELAKNEIDNKLTARIDRILENLSKKRTPQISSKDNYSYFDHYNERLNERWKLKKNITAYFDKQISYIKFSPNWEKVEKKYNPIYLFFGIYSLIILILGGVESSIIDNLPKTKNEIYVHDILRIKYLYAFIYYLNWVVFYVFFAIFFTQKVDKKNGKPTMFYKDPNKFVLLGSVLIVVSFLLGYKLMSYYDKSYLTECIYKFDILLNLYLIILTKKTIIFFVIGTIVLPSLAFYSYVPVKGWLSVVKAYIYVFFDKVIISILDIILYIFDVIQNIFSNDEEDDDEIFKNLNLPKRE